MSRHLIDLRGPAGPVHVVLGWDRPLAEFFVQLWADGDAELPSHDSLHTADADWRYFETLAAWLHQHGLALPEHVATEVLADAAKNIGNRVVLHSPA